MSSFDIPIDLARLRYYHPYADALAQIEQKKGNDLSDYQFKVHTKYNTREETEDFINQFTELLTEYGFIHDHTANDLLFFSTFIYEDIGRIDSEFKDIASAKTTLKSLLDVLKTKQQNKPKDITIEVKGKIGDKAVINGATFINELYPIIINILQNTVYNTTYNVQLAKLVENVEPSYEALSPIYENLKLTKKRPYSQAISYNANLILNYLNNETELNKGEATVISDRQCQFIYQYLCLFEFLDDNHIESLPKDYIRSMIENLDLSSI